MTNGFDKAVMNRSVTRGDEGQGRLAPIFFFAPAPASGGYGLAAYGTRIRDRVLSATHYIENQWGNALFKASTKMAALGWDVEGGPRWRERAYEMLHTVDKGRGWVHFLQKHLADFLTTDNGTFVEVVRASGAAGSKIVGLVHLDSLRCVRTGNPNIPVLYMDLQGREHELKAHQVLMFSDMPSPRAEHLGLGFCAASRAFQTIVKLASIEAYVHEKVTGKRPLALHLLLGAVKTDQIEAAIKAAEEQRTAQGYTTYMGAFVVPVTGPEGMTHVQIPLAELPDGFNAKEERSNGYVKYANSIGLDVQDLEPLASSNLGTSTQSQVLDDKSSGTGLVAWRQAYTHMLNRFVFPESVTFAFTERDYRDQRQQAEVNQMHVNNVVALMTAGVLDAQKAQQMLADLKVIPKEFIAEDATPVETLSDDEKPDVLEEQQEAQVAINQSRTQTGI